MLPSSNSSWASTFVEQNKKISAVAIIVTVCFMLGFDFVTTVSKGMGGKCFDFQRVFYLTVFLNIK